MTELAELVELVELAPEPEAELPLEPEAELPLEPEPELPLEVGVVEAEVRVLVEVVPVSVVGADVDFFVSCFVVVWPAVLSVVVFAEELLAAAVS